MFTKTSKIIRSLKENKILLTKTLMKITLERKILGNDIGKENNIIFIDISRFKKIIFFLIGHKFKIIVHIFHSILKDIIFSSLWLILRLYPNDVTKNVFKMHHYVDLITLFSSNLLLSSSTISITLSTSSKSFSKLSSFPSLDYIKSISK